LFSHIPLNVDAVLTLDAHLIISSAKETVTVTSEAVAPVNINDARWGIWWTPADDRLAVDSA